MAAESPIHWPDSIRVPLPDGQRPAKETRDFPENGIHLPQVSPYQSIGPLPLRNLNYEIQRPFPNTGPLSSLFNHHPRYLVPRFPLTIGTELPNENLSPSSGSQDSSSGSDSIMPLPTLPVGSFPLSRAPPPHPPTDYGYCASPTSTIDISRTSIATELLFRQSTTSASVVRLSNIPPFPPPWYPPPSQDPPLPQDDPRLQAAGLVSPLKTFQDLKHNEKHVSVVPQKISNPRWTRVSLASSQAIPSSWGYDFPRHSTLSKDTNDEDGDKPKIRAISRPNPTSMVSNLDSPTLPLENLIINQDPTASSAILYMQDASQAECISPTWSKSHQGANSRKPSTLQYHTPQQHDEMVFTESLIKEIKALPKAMPTIPTVCEKKLSVPKPAHFEAAAVPHTEARSTTPLSLIDLIRSATDQAPSLDHGNTASRTDISGKSSEADFRAGGTCRRDSGSFSDILAEFPPPGLAASKIRGFLPVSIWRAKMRTANSNGPNEHQGSGATPPKRGLKKMSRKQLIMVCILALSTILLAVLLPVLLVARAKDSATFCGKTTTCQNGGVSVSTTTGCSCVCANGYTGYRCTTIGDSSCVTSDVTSLKDATMGSSLPSVFNHSQIRFGIHLDQVAIMALLSTNNVSCKTENKLVSFTGVEISSTKNGRRSIGLPISEDQVESVTVTYTPTESTTVAPRSLATKEGILYDDSATNVTATEVSTDAGSMNITTVPSQVVEFSQVAVLYILEQTGYFESAVNLKENIQSYLVEYYNSAIHPSLQVLDSYDLDFQNETITLPNGTRVGE
ncbi:hypothetical protein N7451_005143 [Penicillium sp. IBT 35674x]|nr:hypothetical protein N7451_005143 [Penicillium sp. IBT 35674x]